MKKVFCILAILTIGVIFTVRSALAVKAEIDFAGNYTLDLVGTHTIGTDNYNKYDLSSN